MKGMVFLNESLVAFYRMHGTSESFDYHSHREYEIYFFHAGSCRYLIHNQIYDLEPGDILLMDGMTLHKPNVQPNSEYIRSVVHFSPQWIKGVLKELNSMYLLDAFRKMNHCLIRTRENKKSKQLEKVVQRLAEVNRRSQTHDKQTITEMKVLLLQVLVSVHQLSEMNFIKLPEKKEYKWVHAENIVTYLQSNYMYDLTLSSIAEVLNLSKSYVSHVFKEMTGFTVMEYLMACRLTQVKYLLEMQPTKSLKSVAFESGFESASHFSRYFHKKVGMTPMEYRRERKKLYNEER